MTFYLKPPRGEIHLQKVIDLCQLRCQFLNLLDEANIEEDKLVRNDFAVEVKTGTITSLTLLQVFVLIHDYLI